MILVRKVLVLGVKADFSAKTADFREKPGFGGNSGVKTCFWAKNRQFWRKTGFQRQFRRKTDNSGEKTCFWAKTTDFRRKTAL